MTLLALRSPLTRSITLSRCKRPLPGRRPRPAAQYRRRLSLVLCLLPLEILAQSNTLRQGAWPRDAFADFSDASASSDAFVEAFVLANSERRDIITPVNPGAGYSHGGVEFILSERLGSLAPPAFAPPRAPGSRASILARQWCLASDFLVSNSTITSLCAGRGNVFGYREGFSTLSQEEFRNVGQPLQDALIVDGLPITFDFDHFRSLVQAETPAFRPEQSWLMAEKALALASTAADLNGLSDDFFFEYGGGQPTSVFAGVSSVIGMPSNRRDIEVDTAGNLWNRDYRVETNTRASASVPFKVVLRPGATLNPSNLNATVTVTLNSPIDTSSETTRTGAWLHLLESEASTFSPCRMNVPGVPYIADLGDCSRIDLLRGLAITDIPVGIDASSPAWIADTPSTDGAVVLAATHDWRRFGDLDVAPAEGLGLLANGVVNGNPPADNVILGRQALTLNVDLPLYQDFWVNLFTQGRMRLGHHENGLYAMQVAENFSILTNLEGGEVAKGGTAGGSSNVFRLDPNQPNADQFAIVTALDSHLAELAEDIFPGPDSSNPRIGAAHPQGLLVSYGAVNTQPVARVAEPDGNSWFVDLPTPIRTVGVNQQGFLVASQGLWQIDIPTRQARALAPLAAPSLELFPPAGTHVRGFGDWLSNRGRAFFTAVDPDEAVIPEGGGVASSPVRIWISDGTDEGTVPFATADGGGTDYDLLEVLGDRVLFAYYLDTTDPRIGEGALWVSTGTGASTRSLGVLGLTDLRVSTVAGNRALVQGRRQREDGQGGFTLELGVWSTNGTPEQTFSIAESLAAENAPGADLEFTLAHQHHLGGLALLIGRDPATDSKSLWVTDGTGPGTREILTLLPNSLTTFDNVVWHDGYLYFALNPNSILQGPPGELWRTDGSVAGTEQISPPWGDDTRVRNVRYLTSINGFLAYVLERDIPQEVPFVGDTLRPRMNLWLMAAEDLHFPVFRNGPILNVSPGAPPFVAYSQGQIGDLTVLNDRLYFVGNGDPNNGAGTVPFHGQELFAFNTERPGLKDPRAARLPPAGPVAAPVNTRPVPLVVFRDGFETGSP